MKDKELIYDSITLAIPITHKPKIREILYLFPCVESCSMKSSKDNSN